MFEAARPAIPWTDDEVRAFLAEYGLVPKQLTVEQLQSWWFNLVLRVEADGRRYVLRRYGVTPPEEVQWELALLCHLIAHGFPTIHPLPRVDGSFCGSFGSKPAILYPYVQGENACNHGLDPFHAMAETATTIGRLHHLTHGLTLPFPRVQAGSNSLLLLDRFLRSIRQRGVARSETALAELVERAERASEAFASRIAPYGRDLPYGVVHRDAHCANVLFHGQRLVALIDFDDACPDFLVADLPAMLNAWAIDRHTNDMLMLPERAAHLLRAYQRQRRLTGAERDLLPDFYLLYTLGDGAAYVQGQLERGLPSNEAVANCNQYRRHLHHSGTTQWRDDLRRAVLA